LNQNVAAQQIYSFFVFIMKFEFLVAEKHQMP